MNDELYDFPCAIPIKIMGRDSPEFREHALELISGEAGPVVDDDVREQASKKGTFVSLTVNVEVENREQLERIYRVLKDSENVLMVL